MKSGKRSWDDELYQIITSRTFRGRNTSTGNTASKSKRSHTSPGTKANYEHSREDSKKLAVIFKKI